MRHLFAKVSVWLALFVMERLTHAEHYDIEGIEDDDECFDGGYGPWDDADEEAKR